MFMGSVEHRYQTGETSGDVRQSSGGDEFTSPFPRDDQYLIAHGFMDRDDHIASYSHLIQRKPEV